MDTEKLNELCKQLEDTWRKVAASFEKMTKALNETFEKSGDSGRVKKKVPKSLRTNCKKYDYIPIARKNLPYQRRRF